MAISFASAPGNCFNRMGKLGLLVSQVQTYQAAQNTNMTNTTTGVVAQFNSESDLQALMGSQYIQQLDSVGSTVGNIVQQLAAQTVNRIVYRDNPQLSQSLQSLNTTASINEIIRQMKLQGATVLALTIASTPNQNPGNTNTGNGILNTSVRRPLDGLILQNTFAETLTLTCTLDSYLGGATAGNETFSLTGTGAASPFAFNWPLGSNATTTLQAIDGNQDDSSGNELTNSDWADWTSGVPDQYTIVTGGGNLFQEVSLIYDGSSALRWLGDGTTNNNFYQEFNNSTDGTAATLTGLTQYSFNIFMRRDAIAAGAGTLTIDLVDVDSGLVIADANGTANSFTVDLTALTTNYLSYTGVIRTPLVLPTTYALRYRITTGLTSGRSVYLAKASLGEMTQAYTSGPYYAIHAGAEPFVQGDYMFAVNTNSRGAGGTLNTFQTLWARALPLMITNEFILPYSSVPSIADSLIG